MRTEKRSLILGLLFLFGFALSAKAEVSVTHVRAVAATCAACHGTQGNNVKTTFSNAKSPKTLAGIDASFFIEQLHLFQSGERKSTVMSRYAKGLTGEEIEALAAYFSAQSSNTPELPKAELSENHQHQ